MSEESAPLSEESRKQVAFFEIENRFRTVRTGIRSICWLGAAFFAFKAMGALAGQRTSLILSLVFDAFIEVKFLFAITLAGACAAWAAVERGIRHRKVENLQGRIKKLETAIDPNRTTSELTPQGKTNPVDRRRP